MVRFHHLSDRSYQRRACFYLFSCEKLSRKVKNNGFREESKLLNLELEFFISQEISASNLFKEKLNFDHVQMNNPDWKYKGFFMRYQEIHLKEEFYEKLKCPRTAITEWDPVSLIVDSKLSQVGNTSCK